MSRLTILDIAKMAGTSKSTVSRVLNGEEGVSAATKQRILDIIRQENFHPNIHARRTVTDSCNCLGLYMGDRVHIRNANAHVLSGAIAKCNEQSYDLVLCASRPDRELVRMYSERRVDGFIILNPYPTDAGMLRALEDSGVPYVCTAVCTDADSFEYVDTDNEQAAFEAVEYLIRCGHRRIAMLQGDDPIRSVALRATGYERALHRYGIPLASCREILVRNADYAVDFTGLRRLLEADEPVTACFAASDMLALQTAQWLTGNGYRIPEDVSLVGFDDLQDVLQGYPLTTVRQDFFTRGYDAARYLIGKIRADRAEAPCRYFVPYELVQRRTVRTL